MEKCFTRIDKSLISTRILGRLVPILAVDCLCYGNGISFAEISVWCNVWCEVGVDNVSFSFRM